MAMPGVPAPVPHAHHGAHVDEHGEVDGNRAPGAAAHAARADLCRRLGTTAKARAAYQRALEKGGPYEIGKA